MISELIFHMLKRTDYLKTGDQLGIESEGKVIASIEKNHHKRTLRYLNQ